MRIASAPIAPTPITPTVSPGSIRARLERLHHARARLHEHRRVERHVVGKRVQDPRGDDDELAPAAAAREADGVVARAEMRVARAAARAAAGTGCSPRTRRARPARRPSRPRRRSRPRRSTRARERPGSAPSAGRARRSTMSRSVRQTPAGRSGRAPRPARLGRLDLAEGDGVRLLDHDGAHGRREPTTAGRGEWSR